METKITTTDSNTGRAMNLQHQQSQIDGGLLTELQQQLIWVFTAFVSKASHRLVRIIAYNYELLQPRRRCDNASLFVIGVIIIFNV